MFGGFLGFITALIVLTSVGAESVSEWLWLLWGTLIGAFFELLVRMGAGEGVGDAVSGMVFLSDFGGDSGSSGGSSGDSGDSGGSSCGGGCGGGGD